MLGHRSNSCPDKRRRITRDSDPQVPGWLFLAWHGTNVALEIKLHIIQNIIAMSVALLHSKSTKLTIIGAAGPLQNFQAAQTWPLLEETCQI